MGVCFAISINVHQTCKPAYTKRTNCKYVYSEHSRPTKRNLNVKLDSHSYVRIGFDPIPTVPRVLFLFSLFHLYLACTAQSIGLTLLAVLVSSLCFSPSRWLSDFPCRFPIVFHAASSLSRPTEHVFVDLPLVGRACLCVGLRAYPRRVPC